MRGPLPGVPPVLQPVAHSLLQSREEVERLLPALGADRLAARPGGAASVAFHVRHAAGSLDRLLTYARGESLTPAQLETMALENVDHPDDGATLAALFGMAVERALTQVAGTDPTTVLEARGVGRRQLPSTVLGLLFHAAEHTQRHIGQATTMARMTTG